MPPNKWRETAEPMKSKLKYPNTMEEAVAFTTQFYEEVKERMAFFSLTLFAEHPEIVLSHNRHKVHKLALDEMRRLAAIKEPTADVLLDILAINVFCTRELVILRLARDEFKPNRN